MFGADIRVVCLLHVYFYCVCTTGYLIQHDIINVSVTWRIYVCGTYVVFASQSFSFDVQFCVVEKLTHLNAIREVTVTHPHLCCLSSSLNLGQTNLRQQEVVLDQMVLQFHQ